MGVVDVLPQYLSSVYLFWDPDLPHLALGKLSALWEIRWVQQAAALCPRLQYYCMGGPLTPKPRTPNPASVEQMLANLWQRCAQNHTPGPRPDAVSCQMRCCRLAPSFRLHPEPQAAGGSAGHPHVASKVGLLMS